MNKNIIKIGVPVLVLGGLIAIIAATQKSIDTLSSDLRIEPLDFNSYVDGYISDSIKGQPNSAAQVAYNHLYDVITTESSISAKTPSGSTQLLSAEDAADCYGRAFTAYYSIFGAEANQLFSNTTWSDQNLRAVKTTAQMLMTRQGAKKSADSLNHYIEYVNGYYSAIDLIDQSNYCSGANSYSNYLSKAKQYLGYPYKNNSKLKNITSEVSENAKTGWRNSITKEVDNICRRECSYYNSYSEFYQGDFQSAYNKIGDFNSAFSSSWGGDLKTKLEEKNTEIKTFFNKLNTI